MAGYLAYILTGMVLQKLTPFFSVNVWYMITMLFILPCLKYFPKVSIAAEKSGKILVSVEFCPKYDSLCVHKCSNPEVPPRNKIPS